MARREREPRRGREAASGSRPARARRGQARKGEPGKGEPRKPEPRKGRAEGAPRTTRPAARKPQSRARTRAGAGTGGAFGMTGTRRAALLAMVVCALALSIAVPLRTYLAHFSGLHGTLVQVMGVAPPPKEEAWAAWTGPLGLLGADVGQRVSTPAEAPRLAGTVEWAGQPAWPEDLLIRLDEPAPGIAHLVPHPMGGQVFLTLRMYLYGDTAPAAAAEAEAAWTAWMNEKFAPVAVEG